MVEIEAWAERSLFYLAKMFTEQIKKGEDYDVLKKCISISILDFNLFKDTTEFYSVFHLREDYRHSLYTDKFEFHTIELPKLPKNIDTADDLLYWSKFINANSEEEFKMIATKNPYITEALEELEKISQDDDKRYEYAQREKALRDYIYFANKLEAVKKQTEIEREQKEIERAQKEMEREQKEVERKQKEIERKEKEAAQSKVVQLEKEKREEKIETVRKLLELNLSIEDISSAVHLTADEISQIKNL